MAEQSSFKTGGANAPTQNKKTPQDAERDDEYNGNYKSSCEGVGEDEKWGLNANPVKNEPLPAKGLKNTGG